MLNDEDISRFLQDPQVQNCVAYSLAERDKKTIARFDAKMQELEAQNAELIGQLENMKMTMRELVEERDALKRSNQVQIQATKEDAERIEKLQEHYAKELKCKNLDIDTLTIREQYAKVLKNKELEILLLRTKLAAGHEESTRKNMELQEQHVKELNDKNFVIEDLETHLAAAEQRTNDKLKLLQEEHAKEIEGKDLQIQALQDKLKADQGQHDEQIEDMDLELKTLEDELAACHEQHAKELNDKDLVIQELETRLSSAEQQTVEKILELTNEQKKKNEVVHTELGKLYMELQEAKKPQETLMAQLAAKNKKIKCLMEQHEAKDSEIQNLKEDVKDVEERNGNQLGIIDHIQKTMLEKDREIGAMKKRVADLEAELEDLEAELEGRGGQSEQ